jgi:hypothetical protein
MSVILTNTLLTSSNGGGTLKIKVGGINVDPVIK